MTEGKLRMENGRQPQFYANGKTSIYFVNRRRPQVFKMKDNLIFYQWKRTPIVLEMKRNANPNSPGFSLNGH